MGYRERKISLMIRIMEKMKRYFGGFDFAVYDGDKSRWIVKAEEKNLSYLKAMNAQGKHIFIKPADESCFMLCDDADRELLNRFHRDKKAMFRPGRMVTETSPGNYQIWIRSAKALTYESKLYWLKKMNSDPGCVPKERWGRSPGFRNRKEKYQTAEGFPMSKLIWIDWKQSADVPDISPALFPSTPAPEKKDRPQTKPGPERKSFPTYPGGRVSSSKPVYRYQYETGDNSTTDFRFCLAMMRRNYPEERIRQEMIAQRGDWKHHSGEKRRNKYLDRTLKAARKIINVEC